MVSLRIIQGLRREASRRTLRTNVGEATKGVRWIPWRQKPKKDAEDCDKPRGAVNERRAVGVRMGEPHQGNAW